MKRKLICVLTAFMCVSGGSEGAFLNLAAEEVYAEAENVQEEAEEENSFTSENGEAFAGKETEVDGSESEEAEIDGFALQETEINSFISNEGEIAVLSEDENTQIPSAKVELMPDLDLKAGVDLESIKVTLTYPDQSTWERDMVPNCEEEDTYGKTVLIEIRNDDENDDETYGTKLKKAGTYTIKVFYYQLGEARNEIGSLSFNVRENPSKPFVLGEEEILEVGHNYRTFAPAATGYYCLDGENFTNQEDPGHIQVEDENGNEIAEIINFPDRKFAIAYYLEQGHTYTFDLEKNKNAQDLVTVAKFSQVTEEWDYENENIHDEAGSYSHFRLLYPEESSEYILSTTGATVAIRDSKKNDVYVGAGWWDTIRRSFKLDKNEVYIVGSFADSAAVDVSMAKVRKLVSAELEYTGDACYLDLDSLTSDVFRLKLTYEDGYQTELTGSDEDIYGNSMVDIHFGEPGSTDQNSPDWIDIAEKEVYEVKVYIDDNEIASTEVHCKSIDLQTLPEIKVGQEIQVKEPGVRQLYRFTPDTSGKYSGDGVWIYEKMPTNWIWIHPWYYSPLKAGESYLVCINKEEAGKTSLKLDEIHEHTYKIVVDKAATCGAAGSQHRECTVCGYKEAATEIAATGQHSYTTVVDKAATCGAAGSQHRECTVCGYKEAVTEIAATGQHSYTTVVDKAATCGAAGSQHEECTVCGAKKEATEIPATGQHSFGAYKTTIESTVLKEGTKERTCSVCGKKETAAIAKKTATIKLSSSKITVPLGKTIAGPTVTFGKGDSVKTWKSAKPSIVTVNSKTGKLTGKKAGTSKVTVTLKSGKKAAVTVTVKKMITTTKLKANKTAVTLKKGKSFQLKVTVTPKNSQEKVSYKSSDTKIATVSSKGKIIAGFCSNLCIRRLEDCYSIQQGKDHCKRKRKSSDYNYFRNKEDYLQSHSKINVIYRKSIGKPAGAFSVCENIAGNEINSARCVISVHREARCCESREQ